MKGKGRIYGVILAIVLLSIGSGHNVQAAESIKKNEAYMEDGKVIYVTYDTTASSGITWRTEGFTVKNKRTNGNPTANPKGEFILTEDEKESMPQGDGVTRTIFTFDEEKVRAEFDKAEIDGDSLELTGGYIFLNGIFRVYQGGSPSSGYKKTLNGIMTAAPWRNPNDFRDHFDIRIKYEAKPQPIYITTMKKEGDKFYFVKRELEKMSMERYNFYTNAPMIPGTLQDGDKKLYLYRTHWAKWTDEEGEHENGTYRTVRDRITTTENPLTNWQTYKDSLKSLRVRKYKVELGGIEVVCIYKAFEEDSDGEGPEEGGEVGGSDGSSGELGAPYVSAVIQADDRGNEQFDSETGIPTTECQYVNVITSEYLAQYRFQNYSGTKTYRQKVPSEETEEGDEEEKEQEETYEDVERSYSYWKIEELCVYRLAGAKINNGSLPGGMVYLTPSAGYHVPNVGYSVLSENMIEPEDGQEEIGEIRVRNDSLIFNGEVIMKGTWQDTTTEAPAEIPIADEIDETVLFQSGLQISRNLANGPYQSSGSVYYVRVCQYGNSYESTLEYSVADINDVIVHTPVICDGKIEDVRRYNQMLEPDQSIAGLVLDCNFYVEIPTEGYHSSLKGYGYRDYEKYTDRRQVKFPFDVYAGMTHYKANTWINLADNKREFYLPIWVDEGNYTVEFRSVSINCDSNGGIEQVEELANTDYQNYVATDEVKVQISGRIYGLALYDISDWSVWEKVFRKEDSLELTGFTYTVGNKTQNGDSTNKKEEETLVMIKGSHPYNKEWGIQKTGYVSRFYLSTIGNLYGEGDYINVTPAFYYIDQWGNRKEVDVYYTETIQGKYEVLVKVGSELDKTNRKTMCIGNKYTSVPVFELEEKARLDGKKLAEIESKVSNVYTFCNIMIPAEMRTYTGHNYTPTGKVPAGVDADKVAKSKQKWYFEYYLPSRIYICEKGTEVATYARDYGGLDLKEAFWLKEGDLCIQFQIETITNGKRKLSYLNLDNALSGYCNMWKLEGFQYQKTDSQNHEYSFKDGDTLLYQLDGSAEQDYLVGGTH